MLTDVEYCHGFAMPLALWAPVQRPSWQTANTPNIRAVVRVNWNVVGTARRMPPASAPHASGVSDRDQVGGSVTHREMLKAYPGDVGRTSAAVGPSTTVTSSTTRTGE